MKEFRQKLEDVLAEKFGVGREFTAHLMPLLEALARSRPGAEEWETALACVGAAYHSRTEELDSLDETRVLVRQFVTELKRKSSPHRYRPLPSETEDTSAVELELPGPLPAGAE